MAREARRAVEEAKESASVCCAGPTAGRRKIERLTTTEEHEHQGRHQGKRLGEAQNSAPAPPTLTVQGPHTSDPHRRGVRHLPVGSVRCCMVLCPEVFYVCKKTKGLFVLQ